MCLRKFWNLFDQKGRLATLLGTSGLEAIVVKGFRKVEAPSGVEFTLMQYVCGQFGESFLGVSAF